MKYSRIMLAAPSSGSGKTTITCGILSALKNKGKRPCSFKSGPDYIDPMFHRNVIGIPSGNLDTFFTEDEVTKFLFAKEYTGDIAIIEGVMGLYDGIGGIELQGSSYDLARVLNTPIILVVDAKGAGRSILAQIKGFLDYDDAGLIKGVILNKTSLNFGKTLKPLIEQELGIKVVGTVSESKDMEFSSRHLGLVLPEEIPDLKSKLGSLTELVSKGLDLDDIISLADEASDLDIKEEAKIDKKDINPVKLAVARDRAFCFYYRENMEMLKDCGVEICEFSPLEDDKLPKGVSGIILGGGYPENYLQKLQDNTSMKAEIKRAMDRGMPILAECGGFMYLLDSVKNEKGKVFNMVGAINGTATWMGKLVRFGYVTIKEDGLSIKGHEFHYYDTDNNGDSMMAYKPTGNRSWPCIHKAGNSYVGFPHLYYPSSPRFLEKFVEAMKNYGGN
ncbi:MAG: cobyrinate a,c-diamide synthase [Pseudobutyrivibrio sp.]|nr:cobyrinate a,c-diamide synthase [Pseudobutyrivibrio sp.]